MRKKRIAILGTVGVPANYGGFETLADNLVRFHHVCELPGELVVYCSAKSYSEKLDSYLGAKLRYINLNANGVSSILYDIVSLFSAVFKRADVILLLGVSGAIALPFVRLVSRARIITNIDGIEWKRDKWKGLAKWFLRFSEKMAVKFSHEVVADNAGIAQHVAESYGRKCHVIAYGGDHAVQARPAAYSDKTLPEKYAFALCRIEPENNISLILQAFSLYPALPLVFVGNWNNSHFGRALKQQYDAVAHIHFLDPIYDLELLHSIRSGAEFYVHGHSAGGTNPSLVEMMHFGKAVLAFDCVFNRFTTQNKALFFNSPDELLDIVSNLTAERMQSMGTEMALIANDMYTWDKIGLAYFALIYDSE